MEIRALLSAMWRNRTGPLLVAAQVAITLAAVVNVAYIVQQRVEQANQSTGMDLDNMFWVRTEALSQDFNYWPAVQADLAYLNGLPGVVGASTITPMPQTYSSLGLPFASSPEQLLTPNGGVPGRIYYGTEKILDTLGLKLVAGRTFDANAVVPPGSDLGASIGNWASEIIITQSMANKLFPKSKVQTAGGAGNSDTSALGKTVYVGLVNKSSTVVGIVERMQGAPAPAIYDQFVTQIVLVPIIPFGPDGSYMVRTQHGRRDAIMAKVEKEFADLQPGRFVVRMEAMSDTAKQIRSGIRGSIIILSVVAALVLAVTVIGIVGLAAFNVTTRTKQLGTRRAIGARKFHILRYFLVENWIITSGGALLGCVLALAAGVKLSLMYQMARVPLYYLVAGVVVLWIVGLLAVLVPARRAASISPATATRMV
ncbi:MAG TPA: FtsX-like permease family protein [Steroidobacteraceae bacterium]|nr:FtsX-like permease family protein [Steroidobacteraceae bacterium]